MKSAAKVLLALAAVVALCAGLPDAIFYLGTGTLPLCYQGTRFEIPSGTTMDEVRQRFGPPHSVSELRDGRVHWHYHYTAIGFVVYTVGFNSTGKSTGTWD